MDWVGISKTARAAFGRSVNDWLVGSYVQGGSVRGPNAELTPGSLKSSVEIEPRLAQALILGRVPAPIAQALATELGGAWRAWAEGFRLDLPGAYPKLAAVPGPMAPPTPAAATFSLSRATSAGEIRLSAPTLSLRLTSALRVHAARELTGLDSAMKDLSAWVDASFHEWKATAQVVNVMGKGDVPTYAPPYVPVGPVVKGMNVSGPGPVIGGPSFGRMTGPER